MWNNKSITFEDLSRYTDIVHSKIKEISSRCAELEAYCSGDKKEKSTSNIKTGCIPSVKALLQELAVKDVCFLNKSNFKKLKTAILIGNSYFLQGEIKKAREFLTVRLVLRSN